ncbi:hypothetical protein G7046_g6448 [Stylonectria norvegica]|nr:hypothetical protein G7046_g6448 [Stylonectria norvegica]
MGFRRDGTRGSRGLVVPSLSCILSARNWKVRVLRTPPQQPGLFVEPTTPTTYKQLPGYNCRACGPVATLTIVTHTPHGYRDTELPAYLTVPASALPPTRNPQPGTKDYRLRTAAGTSDPFTLAAIVGDYGLRFARQPLESTHTCCFFPHRVQQIHDPQASAHAILRGVCRSWLALCCNQRLSLGRPAQRRSYALMPSSLCLESIFAESARAPASNASSHRSAASWPSASLDEDNIIYSATIGAPSMLDPARPP